MADQKISADPVATLVGTELIPVVQGGVNKTTTPTAIVADVVSSVSTNTTNIATNATAIAANTANLSWLLAQVLL